MNCQSLGIDANARNEEVIYQVSAEEVHIVFDDNVEQNVPKTWAGTPSQSASSYTSVCQRQLRLS